jgi:hypothetical protein
MAIFDSEVTCFRTHTGDKHEMVHGCLLRDGVAKILFDLRFCSHSDDYEENSKWEQQEIDR